MVLGGLKSYTHLANSRKRCDPLVKELTPCWSNIGMWVFVRVLPNLLVEVGLGELKGVEQGVGSGQLDVVAGLLLPHALDDGRQDLVAVLLQLLRVLRQWRERGAAQSAMYRNNIVDVIDDVSRHFSASFVEGLSEPK